MESADRLGLTAFERSCRCPGIEVVSELDQQVTPRHVLPLGSLRLLLGPLQVAYYGIEVGEHEFGVDDVNIADRVDACRNMGDIVILEAADDVCDRMGLTDMPEELVAEPLAFRGTGHETRDVDELDSRRHHFLGLRDLCDALKPRIGDGHDADVRVDRAERIVLGRDPGCRQRVEQRRLAHIGQADDAASYGHFGLPGEKKRRMVHALRDGG